MKKLFKISILITALTLLACKSLDDPPTPRHYYEVTLTINLTSGKILSTEIITDFVYNSESIEKWEKREGINTTIDSLNHTAIIKMITHINPDLKTQ
jgi:hypothetical protein